MGGAHIEFKEPEFVEDHSYPGHRVWVGDYQIGALTESYNDKYYAEIESIFCKPGQGGRGIQFEFCNDLEAAKKWMRSRWAEFLTDIVQ